MEVGTLISTILGSSLGDPFITYMTGGFIVLLSLVATTVFQPALVIVPFLAMNLVPVLILSIPVGLTVLSAFGTYHLFNYFDLPGLGYVTQIIQDSADGIIGVVLSTDWTFESLIEGVSQVGEWWPLGLLASTSTAMESWILGLYGII